LQKAVVVIVEEAASQAEPEFTVLRGKDGYDLRRRAPRPLVEDEDGVKSDSEEGRDDSGDEDYQFSQSSEHSDDHIL
jgi:hypothetical protein